MTNQKPYLMQFADLTSRREYLESWSSLQH